MQVKGRAKPKQSTESVQSWKTRESDEAICIVAYMQDFNSRKAKLSSMNKSYIQERAGMAYQWRYTLQAAQQGYAALTEAAGVTKNVDPLKTPPPSYFIHAARDMHQPGLIWDEFLHPL